MRKLFFKLFIHIVGIILVVLVFQCVVLLVANNRLRIQWRTAVVDTYVDSLQRVLLQKMPEQGWSSSTITKAFVEASDDRISGFLISDNQGGLLMTLGKDPRGVLLTHSEDIHGSRVRLRSETPQYDVFISQRQNGWAVQLAVESRVKDGESDRMVPRAVQVADVAGTVVLHVNGERFVTVDILAFDPFTYARTGKLLASLVGVFLWSIPLSLLISFALATMVSRRNARLGGEITKALDDLASGNHPVELPVLKGSEFNDIRRALADLDGQLLQNEKSRNAWIQSISHDLNTPVSSMKLLLEGMEDGIFPMDRSTLAGIARENAVLEKRIKSVTAYATLQSPDAKLHLQQIDVDSLTKSVLGAMDSQDRHRIAVESFVTSFTADATLLGQACKEVLDNALTASPGPVLWRFEIVPGRHEPPTRRKPALDESDYVVITVINEGELPSHKEDYFEPWSTGNTGRSGSGGSGLGLAITGRIVHLHGGQATLRQMNSRGEKPYVVLTMKLPLLPPESLLDMRNYPVALSGRS